MAKPLLDLSTLIERPNIAIDGELYEIRSPDELSVLDHHRVASQGKRLDELFELSTLNSDEQKELTKLIADLTDFVMVGVPPDIRGKLTESQRMDVASVFTVLPLQKHLISAAAAMIPSIGEKRPRGSRGSTGVRPTGGSKKHRSRSSKRTSR